MKPASGGVPAVLIAPPSHHGTHSIPPFVFLTLRYHSPTPSPAITLSFSLPLCLSAYPPLLYHLLPFPHSLSLSLSLSLSFSLFFSLSYFDAPCPTRYPLLCHTFSAILSPLASPFLRHLLLHLTISSFCRFFSLSSLPSCTFLATPFTDTFRTPSPLCHSTYNPLGTCRGNLYRDQPPPANKLPLGSSVSRLGQA